MNFIIYPFKICPECYSNKLKTDYEKLETICSECGLVLKDGTLTTIKQKNYFYNREKEILKELKQNQTLNNMITNYNDYIKFYTTARKIGG